MRQNKNILLWLILLAVALLATLFITSSAKISTPENQNLLNALTTSREVNKEVDLSSASPAGTDLESPEDPEVVQQREEEQRALDAQIQETFVDPTTGLIPGVAPFDPSEEGGGNAEESQAPTSNLDSATDAASLEAAPLN